MQLISHAVDRPLYSYHYDYYIRFFLLKLRYCYDDSFKGIH